MDDRRITHHPVRRLFAAVVLGLAPLLSGCAPADLLNTTIPTAGLSIVRDLAYGEGKRRTLDIYRTAQPGGPQPVVVFIYGGSWRTGSKRDYLFVAAALARRGMLVVVPDYRLYPETTYPGFLRDCAAAVAWTQANAAGYGGDARALFLMGHSAGAYNVAMLALDPAWLAQAGAGRDRLLGAIGLAGPYDFLPIRDPDIIPVFPGGGDPATQPVNHVDGHNPPLLLLAGSDDHTVQPRNTLALATKVRAAGGPVEVKLYPGVGHIGIATAFAPLFGWRAPVLQDVTAFIRAHAAAWRGLAPVAQD